MMSELGSPVGRKMFWLITSEGGGVSGWSCQDTVVLSHGPLCLQHIQPPAPPLLPWPRSPRTLNCKVTVIKTYPLVFLSLYLSSGLHESPTQSCGMKFNLHSVHNFFFLYPGTEYDEVIFSGVLAQDLNH